MSDELTMDELIDQAVDQAAVDSANKESLPPAGSYVTNPSPEAPLGMGTRTNDDGRPMITVYGPGEDPKTGTRAMVRATMSPEAQRKLAAITADPIAMPLVIAFVVFPTASKSVKIWRAFL